MVVQILAVDTVRLYSSARLGEENIRFYHDVLSLPLVGSRCQDDVLLFKLHQRELRIEFAERLAVNRFAVRVTLEVADLDETYGILVSNGYDPEFYRGRSLATERVFVSDPTGYRIELLRVWPLA